ncbi:orotate phosphoribosyltransferase [Thermodesulfobacteriota bacterium]
MEEYKQKLARVLAETGALFFDDNLFLKDGRPTPYFVNFGMFRTGRLSKELGSLYAEMIIKTGLIDNIDIVLGPSYKGSAIALSTAIALYETYGHDLFFEYDRKEAKRHGEGSISASLTVNRTFYDGCQVYIVDDVTTTMGTKYELIERMENEAESKNIKVNITGVGIAVNREQSTAVYGQDGKYIPGIKGDNTIKIFTEKTGIPVNFIAGIKEVVDYLYKENIPVLIRGKHKAIDEKTKSEFDQYLEIYGV